MGSVYSKNITEIRNALGLSKERFGQLLGVSGRSVIRWKKAHTSPERQEQRVLLDKLREVIKFGLRVYFPEGLHEFLLTRLPEFNGKTPFQMILINEHDAVLGALSADYEGLGS